MNWRPAFVLGTAAALAAAIGFIAFEAHDGSASPELIGDSGRAPAHHDVATFGNRCDEGRRVALPDPSSDWAVGAYTTDSGTLLSVRYPRAWGSAGISAYPWNVWTSFRFAPASVGDASWDELIQFVEENELVTATDAQPVSGRHACLVQATREEGQVLVLIDRSSRGTVVAVAKLDPKTTAAERANALGVMGSAEISNA